MRPLHSNQMASFSRRLIRLSAQLDHHHLNIRPATSSAQPSLRPSASLIIIRPLQSITPDGYNYRTLLIQRNVTQSSFSSAHVFPGGNLEPDDHNHHPFVSHSVPKDIPAEPSDLQTALKLCAIRETFEEAGILVGLSSGVDPPSSVLRDFRQKLIKKSTRFSSIIQHLQAHAHGAQKIHKPLFNLDDLVHYANILTPTTSTKRWDTHFYLCILPSPSEIARQDDFHIATPDESETVSAVWLSPSEALKQSVVLPSEQSDSIALPPPQFYILTDLARWKDHRQLMTRKRRKVFPFTPEIVKQESEATMTFLIVFPGDPLHSTSKELCRNTSVDQQSIIHRIHGHHEASDFGSQPGKFIRPVTLQRSGIYQHFGEGWEDLD